jgi:predicted secreted Zn-dependent protease
MKVLAEQGLRDANDPSCVEMYTMMQEMALRLHDLADREAGKHIDKEKWD